MATTDKNGREILPGDTLKIYHFTGSRKKKHYMYKFVAGVLPGQFFNILHLNLKGESYRMKMDGKQHEEIEIVQGFGADGVPFDERPKA